MPKYYGLLFSLKVLLSVARFNSKLPTAVYSHFSEMVLTSYEYVYMGLHTYWIKVKVKFSHTRYRALGPELIPVYTQSARR